MNLYEFLWALLASWCWITLGCYFLRHGRSYAALFFTCFAWLPLLLVSAHSLSTAIRGVCEVVR